MPTTITVLSLLILPRMVGSQEPPKSNETGLQAAKVLLENGVKAGALKLITESRTNAVRIVIADGQKMKDLVKQHSKAFTPALREGLLEFSANPGVMSLL